METPQEKDSYNPEEEIIEVGNWKIVELKKQENVKEENKTELLKCRTKLYRFNQKESQWQERGLGNLIIIKNDDD